MQERVIRIATQTPNYNLIKPADNDTADIAVINANMDAVDAQMKLNADAAAAAASAAGSAQNTANEAIPKSLATASNQVLVSTASGTWAVKTLAQFKSWLALTASNISDFAASVRSTVLTGLSTATNAVITASDTVLTALGKLQAQITGHASDGSAHSSLFSGKLDTSGDGSNLTTSITQATSRTNLTNGETHAISFGKIMKWFTDLGSAAFKTAGNASGSVPVNGSALGTTPNVPVVTNSSGELIPHGSGALGAAAFAGYGNSAANVGSSSAGSASTVSRSDHVHALPDVTTTGNTSSASPSDGSTVTMIDSITTDGKGRVTAKNTKTVTLPFILTKVLTGLSTATNAVITTADTILSALGKLQAQISVHKADTSNPHNVTAAQVGAVNKSGDTIGVLTFGDDKTSSKAVFGSFGHHIGRNPATGALEMGGGQDVVRSLNALYVGENKVYHVGAKPTPDEIGAARVITGSYVGTGTTGSGSPNTLNPGFTPKLVFLCKANGFGNNSNFYWMDAAILVHSSNAITSGSTIIVTWGSTGVSWYSTNVDSQFNASGTTYNYVVIG